MEELVHGRASKHGKKKKKKAVAIRVYHFLVTQVSPIQCVRSHTGGEHGEAETTTGGLEALSSPSFHFSYFQSPQTLIADSHQWWKEGVDMKKKTQNRQGKGLQFKDHVWGNGKRTADLKGKEIQAAAPGSKE
jgi:hypothetical protein